MKALAIIGVNWIPSWWWAVLWAIVVLSWAVRDARREDRRRKAENQPHTVRDSVLMLLAGLILIALFFAGLNSPVTKRIFEHKIAGAVAFCAVAGGLTWLLGRRPKR